MVEDRVILFLEGASGASFFFPPWGGYIYPLSLWTRGAPGDIDPLILGRCGRGEIYSAVGEVATNRRVPLGVSTHGQRGVVRGMPEPSRGVSFRPAVYRVVHPPLGGGA